ncbi:hypothetical protein [Nonomuraea lactucae]|uniref:hypothetical protein n=1 Tax=Nonomuraea lactucae TaxID=2249762 RepID=UPI001F06320E|nr:hypothetical protein [Nonomuraea lactucae]
MGVAAGHHIGRKLKAKGVTNPVIVEIQGIATLPLKQDRSRGFADALKTYGFGVSAKQDTKFTVETASLLQAKEAGRDEFFMVGGAGSLNAMKEIQS